jgi:membrane protease YdiL (CAAX protease family)
MPSVPPPAQESLPPPVGPADRSLPPPPPQRLWIAPAAVLLGLCGGIFASVVVELVGTAFGSPAGHPTPAVSLLASLALDLSFVGAALWFTALRDTPSPVDFGYRPTSWKLGVGAFLFAGISYYGLTWIYGIVFDIHGTDKLPSDFGVNSSTWALVGTAAFVCVVAPICEEFFFRGFFFGVLSRMHVKVGHREAGPLVAALITGVLFGLAHTGSVSSAQYLIPLGFLGFVLCLVRWRTGSLYPCLALHSFNNSLALGVLLGWNAGAIGGLLAASWALVAAVTWAMVRAGRRHLPIAVG